MMINKNVFYIDVKWNSRTVLFLVFLILIPNVLSILNISTPFGFKLHFFQVGIILAALLYGPFGGAVAGAVGSAYSAFIMNNPYIIGGNAILGFFCGYFIMKGMKTIYAVILAFVLQIPYLIITDYFLVNLPMNVILMIVVALAVSNSIWAYVSSYIYKNIKPYLQ